MIDRIESLEAQINRMDEAQADLRQRVYCQELVIKSLLMSLSVTLKYSHLLESFLKTEEITKYPPFFQEIFEDYIEFAKAYDASYEA